MESYRATVTITIKGIAAEDLKSAERSLSEYLGGLAHDENFKWDDVEWDVSPEL